MATQTKAYCFRMEPTAAQEAALKRMAGARRWVWNWALARKREYHQATGKTLTWVALSRELTVLKSQPETAWLKEANAQALQQTLRDLEQAFAHFFARRAGLPLFKSRKRDPLRFRIPQRVKVKCSQVYLPKVGWIRIRQSQPVTETVKSATFRRRADGHWYVALTVEFETSDAALPPPDPASVVGVVLGRQDFLVTSDGERVPVPKFY
ncbi:MAG: transposase, partial [Isosphaeraceae bacterium]|nr:transposase [Isosphaeraceae bacterium]